MLNMWFITTCVLFSFAFVMVYLGMTGFRDAIIVSLLALVVLTLSGFVNIIWLVLYNRQLVIYSPNSKRVYYILSYTFTSLIFLIVVVCYNYLSHQPTDLINIISLLVISLFVNTLIVTFHNYIILQDAKVNADMENSHLKQQMPKQLISYSANKYTLIFYSMHSTSSNLYIRWILKLPKSIWFVCPTFFGHQSQIII